MNESLADRIFSIATAPYSGNPDVQCDMSLALDAICDEVRALVEEITELKTIHKGYRKRMMSEIVELKSEITEQKDWNKKFIDMPNAEIEELKAENAELEALTARQVKRTGKLTGLLDEQLGTPCEQIRHKQERDELKAELVKAGTRIKQLENMIE